jgi:hypothetical protein
LEARDGLFREAVGGIRAEPGDSGGHRRLLAGPGRA